MNEGTAQPQIRRLTPTGVDPTAWLEKSRSATHNTVEQLQDAFGVLAEATLLVAAAHPDDETIGAGRLAHAWAQRGGPTMTLQFSDGEACFQPLGYDANSVAQMRLDEWRQATAHLGFRERRRFGLPDGRLDQHQADMATIIRSIFEARATTTFVVAAPTPKDPHPDHAAVGRAIEAAARDFSVRVVFYPIWFAYWLEPEEVAAATSDLIVVQTGKRDLDAWHAALAAYNSQLRPIEANIEPVVPANLLARYAEQVLLLPPES